MALDGIPGGGFDAFKAGQEFRGSRPCTAFVLSGGGSCGAAQVGMLRELVQAGVKPDFVVGTSVGAINGAFFANCPTADGVARLESTWNRVRRGDVFPLSIGGLLRLVSRQESLVDPARVRRLLERTFESRRLEESQLPMHVVATDVHDGSPVPLRHGGIVEALMASIAIPALLPPVRIGGHLLMDGGVASNTPIRVAVELGATRIVVLPTSPSAARPQPRNAIELGVHAVSLLLARQCQSCLREVPVGVEVLHVPAPDGTRNNPFEFGGTASLIEAAAQRTRRWLGEHNPCFQATGYLAAA